MKNDNCENRLSSKDEGFFDQYNKILDNIANCIKDPAYLPNIRLKYLKDYDATKSIEKTTKG